MILGISLGFNSSASLWEGGKCLASISEERLNGKKNTKDIPLLAVKECFSIANKNDYNNIDVAYCHYEELGFDYIHKNYGTLDGDFENPEDMFKKIIETECNCTINNLIRVEHHEAHKWSCYAVYGFNDDKHTVLTMDGFGDGISARLTVGQEVKAEMPLVKSPALYYQFVTGALGFKEHQHEGKVTGLATGNYNYDAIVEDSMYSFMMDLFNSYNCDKMIQLTDDEKKQVEKSMIIDFDKFLMLKKTVYAKVKELLPDDYSKDSIVNCAEAIAITRAVQKFTEVIVFKFLHDNRNYLTDTIYLAGGLFANVALNRKFGDEYKHVHICPAMGDEGTAMGSAAKVSFGRDEFNNGFHPEYIIDAGLKLPTSGITHVANALGLSDVVHICSDRSEFGPRALMHRSTVFPATDKELSNKLNKAMGRSEFMPYAPVCREEHLDDLFVNWEPFEKSLHFMTVALFVTAECAEEYPAAVHSDGTCRVQVLHSQYDCESIAWSILLKYYIETKEKMMINTSFNVHNEPTCCTEEQCISAWERSDKFGTLLIGDKKYG